MKKTRVLSQEIQPQTLKLKFWQEVDCAALTAVQIRIFFGIKRMLTELRRVHYTCEGCRSNQGTVSFFQKKLAVYITNSETKEGEELLRIFQLIPGQEGITGTVFTWFVLQGEAGREFFRARQSDPDDFIALSDIELAKELSELKEWKVIDIDY